MDVDEETTDNSNTNTNTNTADETVDEPPSDPRQTTIQEQRNAIKKVGYKNQVVGESWFAISKKWHDSWLEYTMFKKADADIPGGVDNMHKMEQLVKPGAIDNSELADEDDENALKKTLTEHLTHIFIHEDKWKLFKTWYGGGPEFERKVYERSGYSSSTYICIHPKLIRVVFSDPSTGEIDESSLVVKGYPPAFSLKDLAKEMEEKYFADIKTKDDSNSPYVHIWARFKKVKNLFTVRARKATVSEDDLKDEDPERWVEVPDDYLSTKLEDIEFDKDTQLMVEKMNEDRSWPRAKSEEEWKNIEVGDILDILDDNQKWYESCIRQVIKPSTPGDDDEAEAEAETRTKIVVHYIGWNTKWDEPVYADDENRVARRNSHTQGPHRVRKKEWNTSFSYYQHDQGTPEQKGIVGLRNLGNTCFMNSTIQCLAQTPWLTDYFLDNEYIHHINKKNPLGWKGQVATAWANLLHDMFSNQYRTIAPRNFKGAIGKVAPRFVGYQQQDSQELLSFLLDGLHEDLNQIEDKPTTGGLDSDGRPDEVVAREAWKTHLLRNQSVIVDLMQGQYRSEVVCPTCKRHSVTFDPYLFLSIPLPTERHKVIEYTFIAADHSITPKVFGQKMLKVADIGMLKDAIAKVQGVPSAELFVCDIWKSRIHRELRKNDAVGDINRMSDDIFVYQSKRPDVDPKLLADFEEKLQIKQKEEEESAKDSTATTTSSFMRGNNPGYNSNSNSNYNSSYNTSYADEGGVSGAGYRYHYNTRRGARKVADFATFVMIHQHRVPAKHIYYNNQNRFEDEAIGYPLLITVSNKVPVTMAELYQRLLKGVTPFLEDADTKKEKLPFELWAMWGFNDMVQLEEKDEVFELNKRSLKFICQWTESTQFKSQLYERPQRERDASAPQENANQNMQHNRRQQSKPIDLQQCIDAFSEKEVLSETDAWYCSKCKGFKCASKKIDLYNSPDVLIIHLKRFSYTQSWRDRINTLVRYPLNGLDLKPYLMDPQNRDDAIYDLYGVSNHMGGMGGGHYTAYAKSLINHQWYLLDDSRTMRLSSEDQVVSSAAYVLYYRKTNPRKLKHRASRVVIPNYEKPKTDEEDDSNSDVKQKDTKDT